MFRRIPEGFKNSRCRMMIAVMAVMMAVCVFPADAMAAKTVTIPVVVKKTETSANGDKTVTKLTYNSSGFLTSRKQTYTSPNFSNEWIQAFDYDNKGRVAIPGAKCTYDSKGRLIKASYTADSVDRTYSYSDSGRLISWTSSVEMAAPAISYGSNGLPSAVKNAAGETIYSYKYDSNNNIKQSVIWGQTFNYKLTYNSSGCLTKITNDVNNSTVAITYKNITIPAKYEQKAADQQFILRSQDMWAWTIEGAYGEPVSVPVTVTGTYKDGAVNKSITKSAVYDDEYFNSPATSENRNLAVLSMLASAASYDGNNSKKLMKACGFSHKRVERKITKKDNDHVSYSIGTKKAGEKTIVAIWIKGTSSNYEWISNYNVGKKGNDHQGFRLACDEVYKELAKYNSDLKAILKKKKKNSNYVFWITGHSRGAAVANLLAKNITDIMGQDKVYAYTFATPRTSRKGIKSGYKNIFNYLNPGDFVTEVPLEAWGFKRYGNDIVLSANKESAMKKSFKKTAGMAYEGFGKKGMKSLIKAFREYAGKDTASYYRKNFYGVFTASPADYCMKGLALTCVKGQEAKGGAYMAKISAMDADAFVVTSKLLWDKGVSVKIKGKKVKISNQKIMHAHCQTSYLCWLEAMH